MKRDAPPSRRARPELGSSRAPARLAGGNRLVEPEHEEYGPSYSLLGGEAKCHLQTANRKLAGRGRWCRSLAARLVIGLPASTESLGGSDSGQKELRATARAIPRTKWSQQQHALKPSAKVRMCVFGFRAIPADSLN